jgi:hypothetical protein
MVDLGTAQNVMIHLHGMQSIQRRSQDCNSLHNVEQIKRKRGLLLIWIADQWLDFLFDWDGHVEQLCVRWISLQLTVSVSRLVVCVQSMSCSAQ